jgi:hypothetical protein
VIIVIKCFLKKRYALIHKKGRTLTQTGMPVIAEKHTPKETPSEKYLYENRQKQLLNSLNHAFC